MELSNLEGIYLKKENRNHVSLFSVYDIITDLIQIQPFKRKFKLKKNHFIFSNLNKGVLVPFLCSTGTGDRSSFTPFLQPVKVFFPLFAQTMTGYRKLQVLFRTLLPSGSFRKLPRSSHRDNLSGSISSCSSIMRGEVGLNGTKNTSTCNR
jgi:hypothetical protein